MEYKAARFEQKNRVGYLTSMKVSEFYKGDYPIVDKTLEGYVKIDQLSKSNKGGYQREDSEKRWKSFGKFLDSVDGFCPNPIIGNIRTDDATGGVCSFTNGKLTTPKNSKIWICEGQHRLLGYIYAYKELDIDIDIPIVIINTDTFTEKLTFYYVNGTQKSVKTDLVNTNLTAICKEEGRRPYGVNLTDDKMEAVDMVEFLNTNPESPLRNCIELPGSGVKGVMKGIPMQNSISEMIKALGVHYDSEQEIRGQATLMLMNSWRALKELMPNSFDDPKNHITLKSGGVYVLNRLISTMYTRMKDQKGASGTAKFTNDAYYKMFSSGQMINYMNDDWWKSGTEGKGAATYGSSQTSFKTIERILVRAANSYFDDNN